MYDRKIKSYHSNSAHLDVTSRRKYFSAGDETMKTSKTLCVMGIILMSAMAALAQNGDAKGNYASVNGLLRMNKWRMMSLCCCSS
jgi:hypothetical protein